MLHDGETEVVRRKQRSRVQGGTPVIPAAGGGCEEVKVIVGVWSLPWCIEMTPCKSSVTLMVAKVGQGGQV